jgi:nitrogen fixation protein FixH
MMFVDSSRSEASQERRSKIFWVTIILAFFALDIAIAVIAIVMAAGDPSFRPMPDYGDRSVTWEAHHQDRVNSEKLGWSIEASVIEPDRKAIEFIVTDRDGNPVDRALGIASAYHLTRVAEQKHAEIVETVPGRYVAEIDCQRPGLWKIDLRLTRKFAATAENSIASAGKASEEVFVYESTIDLPTRP